ncbi:hypothetical protein KUTeg_024073 [Tegillarca granosa]|uniref:Acyclic terpene utilisation N-terminal domain-containing protein n=1 Tax=Tegillarca granosa TaxID=220873 RepID=A0ABQ9E0W3_TEGGR|nr:hypothetical protein KUTeg_024073 [Tegillarca granosa]
MKSIVYVFQFPILSSIFAILTDNDHVTVWACSMKDFRLGVNMAALVSLRLGKLSQFATRLTTINGFTHIKHRRYTKVLPGKTVKIGCASGFWGDTAIAAPQLIYGSNIDYLVFDYLSEITMSLLTAAKHKKSNLGYAPDFVQISIAPFVKDIKAKGIRVVSNAGGVNPLSCAAALQEVCDEADVKMKIAVITGDDLMDQLSVLENAGLRDMDSGKKFPSSIHSMNAYLGNCKTTLLFVKFQWQNNDFDSLAAGSLAGHLVECGAQVTGGIFTDWWKVDDWEHIGFPVVECAHDGSFIVSKPQGTGGLVSKATVSEQLLYELGDPCQYILPDVVCDFSNVKLDEIEGPSGTSVFVSGAKGNPPSGEYKVSATYADGFRSTAVATIGGPRSKEKAIKTANEILKRCRRLFKQLKLEDFSDVNLEILGSEHMYGPHSKVVQGPREGVMWLAVTHNQKKALEFFAREIAPAGTGMAPGLCGIVGGRPKVSPVLKLFSFLYPKDTFDINIFMNGEHVEKYNPPSVPTADYVKNTQPSTPEKSEPVQSGKCTYRLEELAYTRSGDKGNTCNIENYFAHVFPSRDGVIERRIQRVKLLDRCC